MDKEILIVSFNVRGIREVKKRRTIFRHLHTRYPRHIVVLSESHSSEEDERQWTAEWGGQIFFAHGNSTSRGTCVLIPRKHSGDVNLIHSGLCGRIIALVLNSNGLKINLIGVYAPTQSNGREQTEFYEDLNVFLRTLDVSCSLILCGDMNVHMSMLDTADVHYRETQATNTLRDMLLEFDLTDIWRERNPNVSRFSWRRCNPLQQSRIDYFFISRAIADSQRILNAEINPGVRSDHSIITLSVEVSGIRRGNGLWRCNLSLLEDTAFTEMVKEEVGRAKAGADVYVNVANKGLLLEVLLGNIRSMCIRKSAQVARKKRETEDNLEKRVDALEVRVGNDKDNAPLLLEYIHAKDELDAFKTNAGIRAMLWSKANWLQLGERPSGYFMKLEKKRQAERVISMLEDSEGNYILEDKNILRFCKEFYNKVHATKDIPQERIVRFMEGIDIPTLDEPDRKACEGPITSVECVNALKTMGNNKAPSVSGFNKEFVLFFWDDLGEIIVDYVNESFRAGKLFVNQRRGILTLLPKAGDQKQLKNKRPICLLDIVYKIIAKVLARRLSLVIKKIVEPDQTGSLKGRNIQDNVRLIQDLIYYTEMDDVPGILCALDFKAAFNSVEHNFLFHVLSSFGFGETFISWIRLLYNDTELAVINNGRTSEWFKPKRGIMQGCPISGMLFTLAVEILAIKVRQSDEIKGITINGVTKKISQYADDSTVFIKNEESVRKLVCLVNEFGSVSGLDLNVNKSKLMWLGSTRQICRNVSGIPAVRRVKILGIWFSSTEDCVSANLDPVINSINVTINMWGQRDLSIKGRITVAKSLLISKLIYIMPCASLSAVQLRHLQSKIMKYIWRGRPPKVAGQVLCQSIVDGGLGAMDVVLLYKSLRLGWVKRMLRDDVAWVQILRAKCHPYEINDLLRSRYTQEDIRKFKLSAFYVDILTEYRKIN